MTDDKERLVRRWILQGENEGRLNGTWGEVRVEIRVVVVKSVVMRRGRNGMLL